MRVHSEVYTDDGKLVKSSDHLGTVMKDRWFVMYKDPVLEFVANAPNLDVTRVWLFLLANQSYDVYVDVSQAYIAENMNISASRVSRAMKWLEENNYLRRIKECGQRKILINPDVASCGRAAVSERKALWSVVK